MNVLKALGLLTLLAGAGIAGFTTGINTHETILKDHCLWEGYTYLDGRPYICYPDLEVPEGVPVTHESGV